MTTIISNSELKVTFNGSETYFVEDKNGTCFKYYKSEKAAIAYFNRLSYQMGIK